MDINASIIDQRLNGIGEEIQQQAADELRITDNVRLKSLAFTYLCVKTILDLEDDEAFDCLTEGGGDFGVDAIHISEEHDFEFTVSLFQAKYKHDLKGNANFPESGLNALVNAIRHLFDPSAVIERINERLETKIEAARSLIRDGYIPQVRALACNNGLSWNDAGKEIIERNDFGDQVTWEHINHERLVKIIQATKPVNDSLQLSGKAIVEDMDFSRVLIGRVSVKEVATLIERHGERLLERNIRRYLGLQGNRVNEAIRDTLQTHDDRSNFYFYNNGITLICDKFTYNALQGGDYQVRIENLQIINGGQTCTTIYKTLQNPTLFDEVSQAYVLVRLYQLPSENKDFVHRITFATNSQNPVDLRDLKANDELQQRLEMDIQQLGYTYRRKRTDQGNKNDITSSLAAQAILSVWRSAPHQAKFLSGEHFGKLYKRIFSPELTELTELNRTKAKLNGTQVVTAVLLYRIAESRRHRPNENDQSFVRYASCFIAMQMGKYLLRDLGIKLSGLNHQNFPKAAKLIEEKGRTSYFEEACKDINVALKELYGNKPISLQQLSATFRRGDLIQMLKDIQKRE